MLESLKMRKWPSEQKIAYWEKEKAEKKLEIAAHRSSITKLLTDIELLDQKIKQAQ